MMDLNAIATFVAVVQSNSFVEAGRRLGIPANTLSRRVQDLEKQLNVRLLHRSPRQLSPTDAGLHLFELCKDAADTMASASREMAAKQKTPSGIVRIAVIADFFETFNSTWVAEFLEKHPTITLEFKLADHMVDLIAERIDLAIRGGHLESSGMVARRVMVTDFVLAASPSYLQRRRTPLNLQDLADHDCITPLNATGRTKWELIGPNGVEQISVGGRFSANTTQGRYLAAIGGLGIALLPMFRVTEGLEAGTLVTVLPDYFRDNGGLYAVFPSRAQILPAAMLFANFVTEKYRAKDLATRTQKPDSFDSLLSHSAGDIRLCTAAGRK